MRISSRKTLSMCSELRFKISTSERSRADLSGFLSEKNVIALNFAKLRDNVEQNTDVIKQDKLYELP